VQRARGNKCPNGESFFEKFAKEKGFDPLQPGNWYNNICYEDICNIKGGTSILSYHKGSYTKALIDLYPELLLEERKFHGPNYGSWQHPQTRRDFFDQLAEEKGFHPSESVQWYKLLSFEVLKRKGGFRVLKYHEGSHIKALIDLYPELHLEESRFAAFTRKRSLHVHAT